MADKEFVKSFLRDHELCKALTPKEIDIFLEFTQEIEFSKGETIADIGDVGDALYIVLSGEVVLLADDGSDELEVGRMRQGELAGEMSFFDRQPRMLRMRAVKDGTQLLKLTREMYKRMRVEHAYIVVNLLEFAIVSLDHLVRRQSSDVATFTRYLYGKGKK
jgi:CRP-like cAMP-binding protein